jgi:EAL domain-containing protein (putative c-di-GMP-specific phosphodiesterase class I)
MEQRAMRSRVAAAVDGDGDGDGELVLLFQPIVAADAGTGTFRVVGAEALLRLRDEALGLLPPAQFHSSLDDTVLARPIGRHVLRAALRATEGWLALGVRLPVAVNISTRHLMHPHFLDDLRDALAAHPRVEVALLGIEITETGPLLDPVRARMVIDACRVMGVEVSLDDFGTGSASLSHIQQMAADTLKIDQSFVRDILLDPRNTAIAAGIITTAKLLGIEVIAEGVETVEQGALLLALGCRQLQGHVISRPMAAEAVPAWLDTWRPPDTWLSDREL